ncbi:MAG TPA: hypothetical protein EYQ67_07825 [Dehalococcoidia bacterium]|jgi:hypothetical protein|nr:hypothetical protein [Dehalococcoidia bacterium]
MASFFSFILAHQGDSADPELLHWIRERLDQIFGFGPWVIVGAMSFIIFCIPMSIIVVYLMQANRRSASKPKHESNSAEGQEQEQLP